MLPYGEDKGVVDGEALTLWLHDVEIVTESVRGRMSDEKVIWWIVSGVNNGESDSKRIWIVFT